MNVREFAQHKFDMLVLVLLIILGEFLLLHFAHHNTDAELLRWTERAVDGLLGALIMSMGMRGTRKPDAPLANRGTEEGGK